MATAIMSEVVAVAAAAAAEAAEAAATTAAAVLNGHLLGSRGMKEQWEPHLFHTLTHSIRHEQHYSMTVKSLTELHRAPLAAIFPSRTFFYPFAYRLQRSGRAETPEMGDETHVHVRNPFREGERTFGMTSIGDPKIS